MVGDLSACGHVVLWERDVWRLIEGEIKSLLVLASMRSF